MRVCGLEACKRDSRIRIPDSRIRIPKSRIRATESRLRIRG
jgi:hypothetical protein